MKQTLYKLRKIERALVAIGLFAMMIIISYAVFNRFVLKNPLAWNEELTRYIFIWVIILGTNIGIEENAHVGIEFFRNLFPENITKFIEKFAIFGCFVFCVYMVMSGIQLTFAQSNQLSASLGMSMAYVYVAIPVGFALMGITYLEILIKMIKNEDLEIFHNKNKAIKFEEDEVIVETTTTGK
ncbi:Hypothetical protein ING2D1G_1207 [Peptoniphilus sp. ING2-D1G]|nr:Hypothetical protein ING2D1G_1207 [Peptoniphilus sp. ING2-D1G]